ncbi:MAG: glutathione S-transferase family protein [Acidobacteria bacterium]|nr:glutathione S-transferase family protein [Acidobacteriota bacterium]
MLKLYSYQSSGNCYKVRLLLTQRDIPFQVREIDAAAGEQRSPSHRARNPQGRVPVVELEDGTFLRESGAILHYFAQDSPFWPENRRDQVAVLAWMFFEQNSHEPYIAGARFVGRYIPAAEQDPKDLESKRRRGRAALKIMDEHLASRTFMAAGSYTIADIALYAYTHVAGEAGLDLDDYAAVGAWLQRVAGQPGHIPITHLCPFLDP